jgi:hypothetical protein
MPKPELLPGVLTTSAPPRVVCDAHAAIRRARRRAWLRDGVQFALLVAVNWLFVYWPDARLPFADRGTSVTLLRAMNIALLGHMWLVRMLPRWTAKRIVATWCRSEREKFQR